MVIVIRILLRIMIAIIHNYDNHNPCLPWKGLWSGSSPGIVRAEQPSRTAWGKEGPCDKPAGISNGFTEA